MKRTGVFATKDQTSECKKLVKEATQTPVIAMSVAHGIQEGGFSGQAWRLAHKTIHHYALLHGLPEIPGYYGIDTTTGEFITT